MKRYLFQTFRSNILLITVSACLVVAYACQEEQEISRPQISGDEIAFTIASDSTWKASRSTSMDTQRKESVHFFTAIGKDTLYLSVVEEENDAPVFAGTTDSVTTRAASLTSGTIKEFYLKAFLDVNNTYSEYMNHTKVEWKSEAWTYSPIKYWPNDQNQKIHMFGYAQSKAGTFLENLDFSVDSNPVGYQGSFSYTMPAHTNDNRDAEAQPDLLFAIAPNQDKTCNPVNLSFSHALSAIIFKIGNVPENVVINDITFEGVHSAGDCNMNLVGSNIVYEWKTTSTGNASYTQNFTGNVADNNDLTTLSSEACFMMIPQTLPDAKLKLTVKVNGNSYPLEKKLDEIMTPPARWSPNKKYTYTISLPEEVEAFVDDDVTGNVKSGLKIINSGLATACFRVTLEGSWVVESEVVVDGTPTKEKLIVGDWKDTDGTFAWGDSEGMSDTQTKNNWRKYGGYYYYMKPVASGEELNDLFQRYTLTASPPTAGAYLELSVVAEAVYWKNESVNDVVKAWPNDMYKAFILEN